MTQVLAATGALFRDRDLFVHDGSKLRRFRVEIGIPNGDGSIPAGMTAEIALSA